MNPSNKAQLNATNDESFNWLAPLLPMAYSFLQLVGIYVLAVCCPEPLFARAAYGFAAGLTALFLAIAVALWRCGKRKARRSSPR